MCVSEAEAGGVSGSAVIQCTADAYHSPVGWVRLTAAFLAQPGSSEVQCRSLNEIHSTLSSASQAFSCSLCRVVTCVASVAVLLDFPASPSVADFSACTLSVPSNTRESSVHQSQEAASHKCNVTHL